MMHKRAPSSSRNAQSGVVLIVAMVMLVVIGLVSVAIMRGAMSADTVSDNTRRQAQALQAAQAALRFCEERIRTSAFTPAPAAATVNTENWRIFSRWQDATLVHTVEQAFLADQNSPSTPNLPQCMAQLRAITGSATNPVVVVTSRGYSDNYTQTNGQTQAGSVVWLQSIVQFAVASGE